MNIRLLHRQIMLLLILFGLNYYSQQTITLRVAESKILQPADMIDEKNTSPEVQVFLPQFQKSTGKAILICPGGGYGMLAWKHEGINWAPFFTEQGIATIVLKYRLPRGDSTIPVSDAEAALNLISKNAKQWRINISDIGIMGFSAGGHLATTVATHPLKSIKPAFQILFYPVITMDKRWTHIGSRDNLLGKDASEKVEILYSNEKHISADTAPAIIIFAADDKVVDVENGIMYFQALLNKERKASLHIFPTGGHGWGFNPKYTYHNAILQELQTWLSNL